MNENEALISEDMLDRMIELAVAKPSPMKLRGAKPLLGEDEYLVHVDYTIPSFDELKREFGYSNVSFIFDGRPFQKHPSCADIDETPGERVMLVKGFNLAPGSETAIKKMDKLGYRPATHLELYAFQRSSPELQPQFWFAALGSSAMRSDGRCVGGVWQNAGNRILVGDGFDCGWGRRTRFLFVRK